MINRPELGTFFFWFFFTVTVLWTLVALVVKVFKLVRKSRVP